ncbi:uncharacterized protein [Temnothorax longispinosus]|uniref:uncharacterized protein isoform X4 n=1 Tax=Temnothorax longispinosus TaxID=300112 RepID=UPI003A99573F
MYHQTRWTRFSEWSTQSSIILLAATRIDQASDCSRKLMSPTNPFIFATLNLHASPHRLPRKRIRALNRECFVDNQHDDQQLNQYKVLNEIGKEAANHWQSWATWT